MSEGLTAWRTPVHANMCACVLIPPRCFQTHCCLTPTPPAKRVCFPNVISFERGGPPDATAIVFPGKNGIKAEKKGEPAFMSRDDDCFPLLAAEERVKLALILQPDPGALGGWPAQHARPPPPPIHSFSSFSPSLLSSCLWFGSNSVFFSR